MKTTRVLPGLYKNNEKLLRYAAFWLASILKKKERVKLRLNVERMIIDKLRRNELVVIGIGNEYAQGHAVVAYGFERIDRETVKVYVYDSNYPLFIEGMPMYEKVNEDIKNMFILFKKIDNRWNYIYAPFINGHYVYDGGFNSFVPDTILTLI